ncbi:hypothetical protein P152DRAFT_393392 [Eremomyces bilateralis CBS 781.70]|uniref:DUF4470 domain-containing protein n=1 Tax=Eremomyces bilateralis CBS 781.70 TaxID=1392243 RepID=A0A6G1G8U3_9PEZI|nr:uncharacterized protein P152DRAFT_393392 [Eremomyces bilateralis CBS 781.70]KAF1814279.1 hypothetical protein P152DRAFT_393392 [Eremomyces bilateralis CBS 781.70]
MAGNLREEGNALYKQRKFLDALPLYYQAANTDPEDYRPYLNLSAVLFELGKYKQSVEYGQKALSTMNDEVRQGVSGERVSARIAKARVVLKDADNFSTTGESKGLDPRHLPRYKPTIGRHLEFFSVGHDTPMSLLTEDMCEECPDDDRLAFFFGGIGDARHFYYTLTFFAASEYRRKTTRKIHFTLNDILPDVFARDLVFFILLDELSYETQKAPTDKATQLELDKKVATLFYLYLCPLVPTYVNDELQRVIRKTMSMLEGRGQERLPSWIYFAPVTCNTIIPLLRSWQSDVFALHSTREIQTKAKLESQKSRINIASLVDQMGMVGLHDQQETNEEKDYFATIMVSPPPRLINAFEQDLGKLLDLPRTESRLNKIEQYIGKNWKVNATMFNVASEKAGYFSDCGNNPFEFGKAVSLAVGTEHGPKQTSGLYATGYLFFSSVATALAESRDRIFVETQLGDATKLLEDTRIGLVQNRDSTWPIQYDHVHLSNVPDYVGGPVASFLYGIPILKSKSYARYSSTCLRNPSHFPTVDHFISEYLCLQDSETTRKIFPYKEPFLEGPEGPEDPADIPDLFSQSGYWSWSRIRDPPLNFTELLSRNETETWLYQLSLKTILPVPRERYSFSQIFSPLNLTIIFRVAIYLHQTGYPAHWLADALENLLANTVTTTARPARRSPLRPTDLRKPVPAKRLTFAPFLAEFRSLAAQWAPVLPFGISSTHIPTRVRRYTLNVFPLNSEDKDGHGRVPAFVLVFWNPARLGPGRMIWSMDLRKVLLPDEKGSTDPRDVRLRENGLAILAVWEFDPANDEAHFWIDEDAMEKWKREDWMVQIWRDDTYRPVSTPLPVRQVPRGSAIEGFMTSFPTNGLTEGEYWSI